MLILIAQVCATRAVGARWGLATARGSHLAFYKRLLKMTEIAPPRQMPGLTKSYSLLAGDIIKEFAASVAEFPADCRQHFFGTCPDWDDKVRATFPAVSIVEAA